MTITDPEAIKRIVKSNFGKSTSQYDNFEMKYGLFDRITKKLAEICNIEKGMHVCDVGCGTGASALALARMVGKEGTVTGIDFSEEMLAAARKSLSVSSQYSNIDLICCDADAIGECIKKEMDAVLYNACIFLVPNIEKTFGGAHRVLREGGIIGMNFLVGVNAVQETSDGTQPKAFDIFQSAKENGLKSAPYGRSISDMKSIPSVLSGLGFREVKGGKWSERMSDSQVRDFYSIPAQSAGLYPKTPYGERLDMLNSLLDHFKNEGIKDFDQAWGWHSGIK
jgi:ubiquinone/menaquinone biosynthesis C-methylase UbiE